MCDLHVITLFFTCRSSIFALVLLLAVIGIVYFVISIAQYAQILHALCCMKNSNQVTHSRFLCLKYLFRWKSFGLKFQVSGTEIANAGYGQDVVRIFGPTHGNVYELTEKR